MIEKDTIKGLECCLDEKVEKCDECPYCVDTIMCKRRELLEDTFNLINHKQELLDAAIAGQETLQKALAEKEREIERLKNKVFCSVVIDEEKHHLDYKQSEKDNGIASLKKKYQSYVDADGKIHTGGASTLISRSKVEQPVLKRKGSPLVNIKGKDWYDPNKPEGSLIWNTADNVSYEVKKVNPRTGDISTVTKYRTQKSTRMAETDDAYSLVSDADTKMERVYADYANKMKSLANQARKEVASSGKIAYSKNAKNIYSEEVKSLENKLHTAELNRPRERQAQLMANTSINAKKAANPNMSAKDIKKVSQQAITKYRQEVGSVSRKDRSIKITDREWEAIQAGAISENVLKKILNNTDVDNLRERATPRSSTNLSQAKINKAKAMSASNYSLNEIAKALGVSTSTVSKYLKG